MGWFDEPGLRVQWRIAQGVLAVPAVLATIWALVVAAMSLVDPAWSLAVVRAVGVGGLASMALPFIGVLLIEQHLSGGSAPATHIT